jgi:hypothetical protein
MAKINTKVTKHGSRSETYSDGSTISYNTFPEATTKEKARLEKIKQAFTIVNNVNKKLDLAGPCNRYFKGLGANKSFRILWTDNSIFINFAPSNTVGFYGATHSNNKDVSVSAWCLDTKNRWMIAATIVHELAHVAGAPGGTSHAAEKAVDKCYFNAQYDKTIVGSIQDIEAVLKKHASA